MPYFQKLGHPNGVALTGTWNITEKSPYSGYFSNMYASRDLVVVGILGKLTSATPQLVYLILFTDQYPRMLIGPIFTDYIFAFLYWRFLKFLDQRTA